MGAATDDQFQPYAMKLARLGRDAESKSQEIEAGIKKYEESLRLTSGQDDDEQPEPAPARRPPAGDEPPLTAAEIEADLRKATCAPDIFLHLSRLCWVYSHPGVDFPEDQTMTPEDLIAWLPKIPKAASAALWTAMARVGEPISTPQDDPDVEEALPGAIELLHREGGDVTIVHLLFSVVAAWQNRVTEREPFNQRRRGSLPRLSTMDEDPVFLASNFPVDSGAPTEPYGQLSLPGFTDMVAVPGCTSWLLWLFDRAGGSIAQGRGAPWDMRLWVYAILQLKVEDRDGLWHTLRFPTEEVIGWLHPNGWTNFRRDWENLPKACASSKRLARSAGDRPAGVRARAP